MQIPLSEFPSILLSLYRIALVSFQDTPFFFPIDADEFCFPYSKTSNTAEHSMLVIAKKEDGIIGFLLGYRSPETVPSGVVAKTMAILPEFRRKGVGSALFQLFYTRSLAEGFENVYYSTMQKSNSPIHQLTSSNGSTSRCIRTYGLFKKNI
jgi:GNAT superfamily N-acetyltransferase